MIAYTVITLIVMFPYF